MGNLGPKEQEIMDRAVPIAKINNDKFISITRRMGDCKQKRRVYKLNHPNMQLDSNTWVRPDVGVVKCNCDATLFQREGYIGMGCVLCDSQGEFIGCHSAKIHGVLSSKDEKCMAYSKL